MGRTQYFDQGDWALCPRLFLDMASFFSVVSHSVVRFKQIDYLFRLRQHKYLVRSRQQNYLVRVRKQKLLVRFWQNNYLIRLRLHNFLVVDCGVWRLNPEPFFWTSTNLSSRPPSCPKVFYLFA